MMLQLTLIAPLYTYGKGETEVFDSQFYFPVHKVCTRKHHSVNTILYHKLSVSVMPYTF